MRRAGVALAITLVSWGCGLGVVGTAIGGSPDGGGSVDGGPTFDGPSADGPSSDGIADAPEDTSFPLPPVLVHAGTALSFERTENQYVNIDSIPIPAAFTIEAWVQPKTVGSEMMIVTEDRQPGEADDQFRLALTAAGAPYFTMTDDASSSNGLATTAPYTLQSAVPLVVGSWNHIAVTKSGASFILYVNALVVVAYTTTSATFTRTKNLDFRIGARMGTGGPDSPFDGLIDDVRLFDTARSQVDIASDFQTELAVPVLNLIGYWRFDETSATVVVDDVTSSKSQLKNGNSTNPPLPLHVSSSAF